jgi:cell division protein FtsQ
MVFKKLKNIPWNDVFRFTMWSVVTAGFIVTVGFTENRQAEMLCSEVNISFIESHDQAFVEKGDVLQAIYDKFGEPEGKTLHSINISLLENIINNNPFVAHAEVFSTIDGKLNIEVIPRNPIVRIVNYFNESFYIDDEGVFMPLSEKYSASVPVATGFIYDREADHHVRGITGKEITDTSFHSPGIEKVYLLADYIRHHEFWNAQVEQVFVNSDGDMELIPRVGNHTIVLGDEKDMNEKFNKLFLFYKEGLSKQGWEKYGVINLKYKDQVVCTKK